MVMTKEEKDVWFSYKIPGQSNIHRCKVDEINLSTANTWKHEREKCKYAYFLKRNNEKFLTEAEEIKTGLRRDMVSLTTGEIYEFETDPKRAIRFWNQVVNVIPVSWDEKKFKKWMALAAKENTPRRCVLSVVGKEDE